LACRLKSLVQASENPLVLKYVINNLGQGVPPDSINWPILIEMQQMAVDRYFEISIPRPLRPLYQRKKELLENQRQALRINLSRLAELRDMEQYELFLRTLAFQRIIIVTGKLQKMKDLAKLTPDELKEKMLHGDLETRWMAIQVIGIKRYPLEGELINNLSDKNLDIRQAARQALRRIGRGVDFGPAIKASETERAKAEDEWREWWAVQDSNPNRKLSEAAKKTIRAKK
jgi:hypothetical protein